MSLGLYCKYCYICMLPPSPPPAFCVCPISLFPLLSCRCHYSVLHPGGILGCQLSVCWVCVACVTRCVLLLFRRSRTRSSLPFQRTKDAAIGDECLFGSDLRYLVWHFLAWLARAASGPFWLMSPVWSKQNKLTHAIHDITSGDATRKPSMPRLGPDYSEAAGVKICFER